mgnify:CR=1 FL=1
MSNLTRKFNKETLKSKVVVNRTTEVVANVLKYILLFGLCFIIIYPILLQIAVALRYPTDINDATVLWIPKRFSLKNFEVAMIALKYETSLWNSIWISFVVTLLQLFSTSLAGYAFARLKFKGSQFLFTMALFTIIVPQTVISLPLLRTLTELNLVGKPLSLFLMAGLGMGIKSGIFIFLFRQFYRGIPVELEEAAYVDGASPLQVFNKVMLPNARGAILTVTILSFVWQWNDYYFTSLFVTRSNPNFMTLTTQQVSVLYGLQQALQDAGVWGLMGQDVTKNPLFSSMILNTSGILVMLPLLVMYLFVQRFFVEGVERTGITG